MGRKGVIQRFPSSEHLKDLGGGPIPGVFQVCEHERVSSCSSSRYVSVFLKKTIADLLQTDHSLHEHSDEGRHEESRLGVSDQIDWSQSQLHEKQRDQGPERCHTGSDRPGVGTTIISHVGEMNCRVKRQVCRD